MKSYGEFRLAHGQQSGQAYFGEVKVEVDIVDSDDGQGSLEISTPERLDYRHGVVSESPTLTRSVGLALESKLFA